CVVKTAGSAVEEAVLVPRAMVAATLGESARKGGDKSPGSRGKMMAMRRAELIKARDYQQKQARSEEDKKPDRDLRLEVLGEVLDGKLPLLVTAHRGQDIDNALRLAREFELRVVIDGGAESYLRTEALKAMGVPVILHAPMARAYGEMKNAS